MCSVYHLQIFFETLGICVGIFIEHMVKKREDNSSQLKATNFFLSRDSKDNGAT